MFSFLKKKDDEYKNQKITYPLLGLILGSTVGYYVPFVFLFTKTDILFNRLYNFFSCII